MSFLNLGKKDQYGKQKRIEHRGKNLRVSRTGGVALRAQTKLAGLNVTANTKHGLRVSSRVAKNTQVALQNGRLVLRGRYGRGPTRLNLSKSGVTVSTRNSLGTFNWVKPNRSSVKIAGVQLRGKKAANIQLVYMLVSTVMQGLVFFGQLAVSLFRLLANLALSAFDLLLTLPERIESLGHFVRKQRIKSQLQQTQHLFNPLLNSWTDSQLQTALLLVITGWGRGISTTEAATRISLQQQHPTAAQPALPCSASDLDSVAQQLASIRDTHQDPQLTSAHTVTALLAQQHTSRLTAEQTVESLFSADEWAVNLGKKTNLQEQQIQIFADFANIRLQLDTEYLTATDEPSNLQQPSSTGGLINLNTATHEQLQSLPHIGQERALDIIALRPITDLAQLTDIHGIGPARLSDIEQAGVEL